MSINEEIVVTCARIAGDIIKGMPHEHVDSAITAYSKMYHVVLHSVMDDIDEYVESKRPMAKHSQGGRQVPIRSEEEIRSGIAEITRGNGARHQITDNAYIKGKLHGEMPDWLGKAMIQAGVTEVFDNRGTANSENRRPHFVSTDGNNTPFWPPRKARFTDGSVKVV